MCGLVGFTNKAAGLNAEATIEAMMDTIIHRGPDHGSFHSDDGVTLGFRRLKIVDLSDEANQPMYNEDRSCVLVFNGEIYNHKELRQELLSRGHRFVSNTDSEVIIHLYEEYGIDLLQRLRGMFAFAVWDSKAKSLLIARDFFGIKPLYYTQHTTDNSLIFGSEIKAFLKHPAFNKELNRQALKPYLTFQYSALDETFFKGVYKLKPGHYILYKNGQMKVESYWSPSFNEKSNSLEYYAQKIRETMQESVEAHRHEDAKVGSFLSGGIDSSYIVALVKPHATFSVGFEGYGSTFDETTHAQNLSQILGIPNYTKHINASDCFDMLPTMQYHMDEPHSNPSSVPLYFLAEMASKHVTVLFTGEGADELFGGYPWYRSTHTLSGYDRLPLSLRRALAQMCKKLPKNRVTDFITRGGLTTEERFIGQAKIFEEQDALRLLKDKYKQGPDVRSITQEIYDRVQNKNDVTKMQYLDLHQWMPKDILLKADKMTAAHSIEVRIPFLDTKVWSLASQIPPELRVNKTNTKLALRAAALATLPEEWAKRPKVGFPVPLRHWLREEKYYRMVKEMFESSIAQEFFHTEQLVKYLDDHYAGIHYNTRCIWTAYVFLVWYNEFFVKR